MSFVDLAPAFGARPETLRQAMYKARPKVRAEYEALCAKQGEAS
jgi:hypothetical protein